MALATITQGCKISGGSMELYLFPYPGGSGWTGATLDLKKQAIYSNIYTDPVKKTGLTATQWALLDSSGTNIKYKSDAIEFDTNAVGKVPGAFGPPEISIEGQCIDFNASHAKDIFNSSDSESYTTAAGATLYGSITTAFGSARRVKYYGAIIRWLSPVVTTGTVVAWDHVVIPLLVINPEVDLKVNRKDPSMAKFSFKVLPDLNILSPDSNAAVAGYYESAHTPAT